MKQCMGCMGIVDGGTMMEVKEDVPSRQSTGQRPSIIDVVGKVHPQSSSETEFAIHYAARHGNYAECLRLVSVSDAS